MSAIHPSSPRGLFGALHCSQSRWFGSLLGELVEVHADPLQLQGKFSDSVDHDDVFFQSRFTDKVTLVELGRGNLAFDALKFFVSDKELERIKSKVAASKLNQSDFIRKSALEKDIIVIDGIREFALELKRIGVNLNQLTKLANQNIVTDCNEELQTIHEEMRDVWHSLRQLIRLRGH